MATVTTLTETVAPTFAGLTPTFVWSGTINLGTPYATAGIEILPAAISANATTIKSVVCSPSADGTILVTWTSATNKFVALNAAGTEIANGTNLSAAGKTVFAVITFI